MAKKGKEKRIKDPRDIPLAQPDRSGPSEATLLQLAQERGLFKQADQDPRNKNVPKGAVRIDRPSKEHSSDDEEDDDDDDDDDEAKLSPAMERVMDTLLWTVSLAMVHGTLDVLVQNQYAKEIEYPVVIGRTLAAFLVLSFLFYNLHAHPTSPNLVPGLPLRFQHPIRQAVFFVAGTWAGCHLIYITNKFSYLYVLKQAPTLGCVWIWSVLELDLPVAVASLATAGAYMLQGGYAIK
ncbi:uncharacterized protein LY79DRAFT_508399 [Colletotrichum navitas]|uniref:DUF7719 domain-containing protein n=1 Tax=Colletotrichum navitas TaxID=681940 RepID=A0AAD8V9T8_9PEZI|nr:uncharacterized protein LY79DRAFT_508399 [Colletotrichum navitas]KAK1597141.1 hypothetical protein LY79DRAFT_508399 [Colletotrichum navitas]